MEYPEDLNWSFMIKNLQRTGLTLPAIAQETGFTLVELGEMEREEYYPPYLSIIKLLDLHLMRCPGQHMRAGVVYAETGEGDVHD